MIQLLHEYQIATMRKNSSDLGVGQISHEASQRRFNEVAAMRSSSNVVVRCGRAPGELRK
jgi:hypothetical protein